MKVLLFLLLTGFRIRAILHCTPLPDVTREQVQNASSPINIAKFTHEGQQYGVRCAGSQSTLRCEIVERQSNNVLIGSNSLRICKHENNIAIMSEERGMAGNVLVIPDIVQAGGRPECGG